MLSADLSETTFLLQVAIGVRVQLLLILAASNIRKCFRIIDNRTILLEKTSTLIQNRIDLVINR